MSIADKWKKYLESLNLRLDHSAAYRNEIAQQKAAFYAGAEGALRDCGLGRAEMRAEVEHFNKKTK